MIRYFSQWIDAISRETKGAFRVEQDFVSSTLLRKNQTLVRKTNEGTPFSSFFSQEEAIQEYSTQ